MYKNLLSSFFFVFLCFDVYGACKEVSKDELSQIIYGISLDEVKDNLGGVEPSFKFGLKKGDISLNNFGTFAYGQASSFFPKNKSLTKEQFKYELRVNIKHKNNRIEYCG